MRSHLWIPFCIAVTILSSEHARADTIDPVTLTQLLIEDEAQDSMLLGSIFGIDPTSPINFTSNVDALGMTFSYNSASGSLYLGQLVSIDGTGSFDGTTNTLTISSSIGLGATIFSADGTIEVNLAAAPKTDSYTRKFPPFPVPGGTANDQECDSLQFASGRSLATCQYTFNNRPFGPSFTESDMYVASAWDVTESAAGFPVIVSSAGFSPPSGGIGRFTTIITTPEPATLLLLISAVSVLLMYRKLLKPPRTH